MKDISYTHDLNILYMKRRSITQRRKMIKGRRVLTNCKVLYNTMIKGDTGNW